GGTPQLRDGLAHRDVARLQLPIARRRRDQLGDVDAARAGETPQVALGDRHLAALVRHQLPAGETRRAGDLRQREASPPPNGAEVLAQLPRGDGGSRWCPSHALTYRRPIGPAEGPTPPVSRARGGRAGPPRVPPRWRRPDPTVRGAGTLRRSEPGPAAGRRSRRERNTDAASSPFYICELLGDLPVADRDHVDAVDVSLSPVVVRPRVAPPHDAAVAGGDHVFGVEVRRGGCREEVLPRLADLRCTLEANA